MVHQHFMLMDSFTVLENIILGHESTKGPVIDLKKARKQVLALAQKYALLLIQMPKSLALLSPNSKELKF